jgi:hypothetical protein
MADVFEQCLTIIKTLCENHDVFISLSPPFELSFEIDSETLVKRLKENNLTEKDFLAQSNHIESILNAILVDKQDKYIEQHVKDAGAEKQAETELLKFQFDKVRTILWNQHLQDRWEIKSSSKAASFTSIDWDIKIKTKDAKLDKIKFPYATCKFSYQREFDSSPYSMLSGRRFESIQMNFSVDEIDYLIKTMSTVKHYLEESEEELTNGNQSK